MKLLGTLAVLAACQRNSEPAPTPGSGSAAPPVAVDDQAEKMRHCPVTVPGVSTEITDIDGGVKLVLRADGDDVAEVRARAHRVAERTAGAAGGGGGRGGGGMRNCPVVITATKVLAANIEGGVEITVRPLQVAQLGWLRAETRARFDRAPIQRATVVREEKADDGEVKLFAGRAQDLDGDGTVELVTGGFESLANGERRSTIRVYRQQGAQWLPVADAGWDGGGGSLVRNVDIADLDGDGRPEIVALGRVGATERVARARVAVLALEAGTLVKRAELDWSDGTYTHGYGLALADLDGDHRAEVITAGFKLVGEVEQGFVRVWSQRGGTLALRAEQTLDGGDYAAMRINDVAVGDVDGDGTPDIITAGRRGAMKKARGANKDLSQRREAGDLSVLTFSDERLAVMARIDWVKGTSLRLRTVVVDDLDGDRRADIVVGGQYDADGKLALGMFGLDAGKLGLRDDASSTIAGVGGELKDLVVARGGDHVRLLATGSIGERPGRAGDLAAWQVTAGKLEREATLVSRNGDETRTRAVVVVPTATGSTVLTIGHASSGASMVGQVLQWPLGT